MKSSRIIVAACMFAAIALAWSTIVHAQGPWRFDSRGGSGPVAQVVLPDAGIKRRTAFIVFEYARQCDPIFSFSEFTGNRLGTAISQSLLEGSRIGVLLNGNFHTWHAAITRYDNGYEAGFGVTNDLFLQFLVNLDSLEYVTPSGERVRLPTAGFRKAVQAAIDYCLKRIN